MSTTSAHPGTRAFERQATLSVVYRFPKSPSASPRFRDRSLRRLAGPRRQLEDTPSLQPHGLIPQCCMLSDRPRTDSDTATREDHVPLQDSEQWPAAIPMVKVSVLYDKLRPLSLGRPLHRSHSETAGLLDSSQTTNTDATPPSFSSLRATRALVHRTEQFCHPSR